MLDSQQSFAWAHAWLRHWNTNSLQTSHKNRLARRDVRASSPSDSQTCKVCSHSVTDIHAQFFLLPSNWFRLVLSHRQKHVSYQLIKHSQLQTNEVCSADERRSLFISSHNHCHELKRLWTHSKETSVRYFSGKLPSCPSLTQSNMSSSCLPL